MHSRMWIIILMLGSLARVGFSAPRSEKELMMQTHTNRLAQEKSPYLLQHAHNPVDWYPWGEEAFKKARAEDKPIFLSIGYATCHWCHVMEHESFENEEIARLMNKAFVCIKVDREERPDIDKIYMTVCQLMTGSGGWPMTIIMTPDKKPFYAATYIPPEDRFGRMGMRQLIPKIAEVWKNNRKEILKSSTEIAQLLVQQTAQKSGAALDEKVLAKGAAELMQEYDSVWGGFGQKPKFPTPHRLMFLLQRSDKEGVAAVEYTLKKMRLGGIFDQVGFGFHRYSTDAQWLVPHFEKMLYDQALLAFVYTEAYERTKNPFYAQVATEILTYVLRDMTAPNGGFYSAEDADSEGKEGLFYLWTADEINTVLGNDAGLVSTIWNIHVAGNFEDEMVQRRTGKNILHLSKPLLPRDENRLEPLRKKLFNVREKRIHPFKDTKILTDWNGLMIAALAKAGRVLKNESFLNAARSAATFVEKEMQQKNRTLWHRYRDGDKAILGHLDDYAFMIYGLLELYESTFEIRYLEQALAYNKQLELSFIDLPSGGYFMTSTDAEKLIVRPKELYDGAIPSGNSVQMLNLLKLAHLTGQTALEKQAVEVGKAFSHAMERSPSSFSQALVAVQFAQAKTVEIVVVGSRSDPKTQEMLNYISSKYILGKVVLFKDPSEALTLTKLAPFTKSLKQVNGKPTVYLCRNFACEQPITSMEKLKQALQ